MAIDLRAKKIRRYSSFSLLFSTRHWACSGRLSQNSFTGETEAGEIRKVDSPGFLYFGLQNNFTLYFYETGEAKAEDEAGRSPPKYAHTLNKYN